MNLYVHVPFCVKKCNYCAFYSTCPESIDWNGYIDGILRQLDEFHIENYKINTLFFGGGTPSLMPVRYAEQIRNKINLRSNAEWTIEANPKTLGSLELKDWKDLGLNRLSVGAQSFDDDELKFLGRIHSVRDSMELLNAAGNLGLRTSGDFIYGLPNHSVADVVRLCDKINASGLKHASLYELTIEKGTRFQNISQVSESLSAEMYCAIQSALKLPRYEVSNYGEQCLHNAAIWAGGEYIGVGESAAGRIMKKDGWVETKIIDGKIVANKLTMGQRAIEMAITGLRTERGITLAALPAKVINLNFVRQNPQYFLSDSKSIKMTDSGLMLLDCLMKSLFN
ncbi:MAG: coproporphyrinogen III oxidase family protein [Rickettsiales bacterium]|jgi:oxygen-independent coproporphyrinogen-3 oxidase|nr:coproporphyrinogen III oxidase family protein [Rickettsiales bacterium]